MYGHPSGLPYARSSQESLKPNEKQAHARGIRCFNRMLSPRGLTFVETFGMIFDIYLIYWNVKKTEVHNSCISGRDNT